MDSQPRLVKGSQGQLVINPLISELRQQRNCVAYLFEQLKVRDTDSAVGYDTRSTQARAAAMPRWQKR
jgi:hypothetical protein